VVAHCRCPPSPVTGVSFKTDPRERSWYVVCYKLESLCAGAKGDKGTQSPSPHRAVHIRLWPVCSFEGKKHNPSQSVPESNPKAAGGTRVLHNMPAFGGRGTLGLLPEACTVSQHQVMSSRTTLGRRSRAARAAVCCTGTHRVAVQTSHRPSMRVRTLCAGRPSSVGMCDPILILTDRPEPTEVLPSSSEAVNPQSPSTPITSVSNVPYVLISFRWRSAGAPRTNMVSGAEPRGADVESVGLRARSSATSP